MKVLGQVSRLLAAPGTTSGPRVAVFGDSHIAALTRAQAFAARDDIYGHIRIARLRKEKGGKSIGDESVSDFCRDIRRFDEEDCVFSAVGGNQYAIISTVRNPVQYDFLMPAADSGISIGHAQLVPFRTIAGHIEEGVRGTVGPMLKEIRSATRAKVFHLAPPPPKKDNAFIVAHFEGRFAEEGLQDFGPTHPELRLKCWTVQLQTLAVLCRELDVQLVKPPAKGVTPEGYLAPHCYATDVTHANRRYGAYVLRQILKLSGTYDRFRTAHQ